MGGHRVGLPLAIVVTVVAAGAATLALRPRSGLIHAAPVAAEDYFSPPQLQRARDYSRPQWLLGVGGYVVTGAALGFLALRPPRRVRRLLERGKSRPVAAAALTGVGISLLLLVVTLPLGVVSEQRARDFGLSTQDWGSWAGDVAKGALVSAPITGLAMAGLMILIRRFPRSWFALAAVAVVALGAFFEFLSPVLIDPLFNKFTPLPAGALRSEVLALGRQAGVHVGQVYRIDASRRTTGANAYVGGLGSTKRVVLYDTLLREFSPDQIRSTVAHELGHVKHNDVPRGLLFLAIVAPAGMLVIQRATERMAPAVRDGRAAGPTVLPAALFSVAVVSFVLLAASNALSRAVEESADQYALDLTGDPAALIQVQQKFVSQNAIDPDPPAWVEVLFGTHPSTVHRIGAALTWAHRH